MATSVDADLLARARAGDERALADLYQAHAEAARRFALSLTRNPTDADDLVADAFARVVAQLRAGRGPATNFRAYLLSTVRNRHLDVARRAAREVASSDQPWVLDQAIEAAVEPVTDEVVEADAVAAFGALPESWQRVLWHVEVEGRPVAEVASMMETRPAAVSSLVYRAREGLKTPTSIGSWVPRRRVGTASGSSPGWRSTCAAG
ncbi:RNA polymerase sigma factor [Nocardioides sp. SYSU DS0651]|uniref:RNA polymerase sigma factor n=1 Tax=Nocardioides sp. SYSU DS0651 TaxID=3415955 RepID=UPI003F4BA7D6